VVGPFLSDFLRGGQEIGTNTLSIFYSMHMLLIPGGLIGLIVLHLYLVIRLGVTSPPWSSDAAGSERAEVVTAPRGLVQPRPRGDGASADVRGRPEG
jgi:quinol-cytochrome oxidoreductase complex cytochrome b subunit